MFVSKISYTQDHRTLLSKVKNDPDFQTMITHKINKTLHDFGEPLSFHHIRKKTNEKIEVVYIIWAVCSIRPQIILDKTSD